MRPLIAIAGEFWDGATGLGLADGFDIERYRSASDGDLLLRTVARLTTARSIARYRDRIIAVCATEAPRIFLSIKGTYLDRKTLNAIKARGATLAMFYPDVDFDHAGVDPTMLDLYDFIFTTKPFHLPWMRETLRGPSIHYIEHGYATRTHLASDASAPVRQSFDLGFVGNFSEYKRRWLTDIVALRPSHSVAIAGPNWDRPTRGTPLHGRLVGELTGAMYRRFIGRCRINLALHHGPTKRGWSDDVSTRTFEIPAARGFMLHIDNEAVRSLFEPEKEIDTFATPEELAERTDFYLRQPDRRARMIEAAFSRAVPAYSYDARAAEMARLMGCDAARR